jgi:hypothetical protein
MNMTTNSGLASKLVQYALRASFCAWSITVSA